LRSGLLSRMESLKVAILEKSRGKLPKWDFDEVFFTQLIKIRLKILPVLTSEPYTSLLHIFDKFGKDRR
jgi:hypothetical protein